MRCFPKSQNPSLLRPEPDCTSEDTVLIARISRSVRFVLRHVLALAILLHVLRLLRNSHPQRHLHDLCQLPRRLLRFLLLPSHSPERVFLSRVSSRLRDLLRPRVDLVPFLPAHPSSPNFVQLVRVDVLVQRVL